MIRTTPLFRWDGTYWGFRAGDQVHDRYGRHAGWVETTPDTADVFDLSGRFLGELADELYVVRDLFRAEPIHRAPRPAVAFRTPPTPPPDREPRDPRDDWHDALPWPLPPPDPPRL
jgi:hypothetical protein